GEERGSPVRLLGLVIGLGGVILLVAPHDSIAISEDWRYMLLALGIPMTLAASNIYRSRFWPAGSEAMPLVIGMLSVQGVCLFFVNLLIGNFSDAISFTQDTGLILTVLGLMAGASYLSSFNLLKVGGPVYLSQMGYVITLVTLLAGIVIWGEHYDRNDLLSMGLILLSVLLMTLTQRTQQSKETAPVMPGR
ncbi:MAG: DMT family transporter, partial [Gammaproteobacteria bacterium]